MGIWELSAHIDWQADNACHWHASRISLLGRRPPAPVVRSYDQRPAALAPLGVADWRMLDGKDLVPIELVYPTLRGNDVYNPRFSGTSSSTRPRPR
ncbi:hypothetical protein L226DRAFT_537938 [Lentinus tigrinus ALCF2SS1-7]|nr:hypothetical protein L226DRAFT_537938 [Lentinus tigrinus ALCF2SS1-7]